MLLTQPPSILFEGASTPTAPRAQGADLIVSGMDLRETVRMLRRRIPLIVGVMIAGALLGAM